MKRKIIAFDLDGTLAESKSPLADKMAEILNELLTKYQVCVISGGKFEQFENTLSPIVVTPSGMFILIKL